MYCHSSITKKKIISKCFSFLLMLYEFFLTIFKTNFIESKVFTIFGSWNIRALASFIFSEKYGGAAIRPLTIFGIAHLDVALASFRSGLASCWLFPQSKPKGPASALCSTNT